MIGASKFSQFSATYITEASAPSVLSLTKYLVLHVLSCTYFVAFAEQVGRDE